MDQLIRGGQQLDSEDSRIPRSPNPTMTVVLIAIKHIPPRQKLFCQFNPFSEVNFGLQKTNERQSRSGHKPSHFFLFLGSVQSPNIPCIDVNHLELEADPPLPEPDLLCLFEDPEAFPVSPFCKEAPCCKVPTPAD